MIGVTIVIGITLIALALIAAGTIVKIKECPCQETSQEALFLEDSELESLIEEKVQENLKLKEKLEEVQNAINEANGEQED